MSPENRAANIADELTLSSDAWTAAETLLAAGLVRDAASRLYYAVYHAAVAVLLTEEIEPKTHGGVMSLLGLHFIKTGKLPAELSATYRRLQSYREAADYTRGFILERKELEHELEPARRFVAAARALLRSRGFSA